MNDQPERVELEIGAASGPTMMSPPLEPTRTSDSQPPTSTTPLTTSPADESSSTTPLLALATTNVTAVAPSTTPPTPVETYLTPPAHTHSFVPLVGRLSVPLPIPIATDLVRKPTPLSGIQGTQTLATSIIGQYKTHVVRIYQTNTFGLGGAIQAIVSRASCLTGCEANLNALAHSLNETDLAMAELVDGLSRLDLILAKAATPTPPPATTTAATLTDATSSVTSYPAPSPTPTGGWVRLKPQLKEFIQINQKRPLLYNAGMMKAIETRLNPTAAAPMTTAPPMSASASTSLPEPAAASTLN